jgi:hexokinase
MNNQIDKKSTLISEEFIYSNKQMQQMHMRFEHELKVNNKKGSKVLNNSGYNLLFPDGHEKGIFASLDLGGTDIKAILFKLNGDRTFTILKEVRNSLRNENDGIDYISEDSNADILFDYQARTLQQLIENTKFSKIPLGYVFSFQVKQPALNEAYLVKWAKEIKTPGVEGEEVGYLLKKSLQRCSLSSKVSPEVIINDTAATLMASSYLFEHATIGSVIGTGYNSAYIEHDWMGTGACKIINLECGNYDKLIANRFDKALDAQSNCPGQQKLEKMVSGNYLGELYRLTLKEMLPNSSNKTHLVDIPYAIGTKEVSLIISDATSNLLTIAEWGRKYLEMELSYNECEAIQKIAINIGKRSAEIIAMTLSSIIKHTDRDYSQNHTIAVNGSLYEKMPGYKVWIEDALKVNSMNCEIKLKYLPEGPSLGAAIAAAMISNGKSLESNET